MDYTQNNKMHRDPDSGNRNRGDQWNQDNRRDPIREAFEEGYHRGYSEGYTHGNDDYHQSLNEYMYHRAENRQPADHNHGKKWHGKRSKSWMWI